MTTDRKYYWRVSEASERVSEASETLLGVTNGNLRYMYI